MTPNYRRTRFACYFAYLSTSSIFCIPALLFVTFHNMYDISYTLLGTLVAINFITQLSIDLIFSFFSRFFNIRLCVRLMPILTAAGLLVYAVIPMLFPTYAYTGLVIGTLIFSVSAGLGEVLLSPTIAALPSEHPERDMSLLHSLYGWGVFGNVLIATLYLLLAGAENWFYLVIVLALLPIVTAVLFFFSPMPPLELSHPVGKENTKKRTLGLALCVACIFLGSASENTMTNWISGFAENALGISKAWGDIFGLALFALLLSTVRTVYAKYGKKIENIILVSMIGAVLCYLTAALAPNDIIGLVACAVTGIMTSMLWPGMLILMEEKMPSLGVAAYALMAAGGDFGASVAPQLMGIIVDTVSASDFAHSMAASLSLTPEVIGMKTGMLITAIFPILGVFVILTIKRYFKKHGTLT
ncbi:MAG: MFS transporter [Clostridia bacterium]|nr:MFS transporter [Clostridia bacterium]